MPKCLTFAGFQPLTANYIYCPNQFFDVCLPHHSRGVVRLVSYILRQTLGYRDANGNPIRQDISVSYHDFVAAGISRGSIRRAVDEAVAAGFIRCVQEGIAKSRGTAAQTARYQLRWDQSETYVKERQRFQGFYTGEGNRSPIPNGFFDEVIPHETLTVVKVVGAVLRYTVGYESQFGRRQQAPLSYSHLQRYVRIGDRSTLASAIRRAIEAGYIQCVDVGNFDHRVSQRRAATYAVKWLENDVSPSIGSKTRPAGRDRFNNPTSNGSEFRPANQFENQTTERESRKDILKQQPNSLSGVPSAAAEKQKAYDLLRKERFDAPTARSIAERHPLDVIVQQISWIDLRNPRENRLGLLRNAIEQNWPEPASSKQQVQREKSNERQRRRDAEQAAKEAALQVQMQKRSRERQTLLSQWRKCPNAQQRQYRDAAINIAKSEIDRSLLRRADLDNPPTAILLAMAAKLGVATGEAS